MGEERLRVVFGTGQVESALIGHLASDAAKGASPPRLRVRQAEEPGTRPRSCRHGRRVKPGDKVLIIGASGGVGSHAVQLAKAFGADVTGVCSTAKLDLVRSLGADHAIDYTSEDFADGVHRYDLILDIAGNPALARLRRALAPTGRPSSSAARKAAA
jgi:NADPH:quinone reductase-like Zn-dependent oxidoreductase